MKANYETLLDALTNEMQALHKELQECKEKLSQEPCWDAISRQAVEDAIYDYSRSCDVNYAQIMEFIDKLPSVTPQQKMGRWIYTGDYTTDGMLKCSECGFEHDVSERFSYCPNCGAKMENEI